jgi:hypothetical protein
MQSSIITVRALSRILKNKFSTFLDPALQKKPHLVSVVCGFPKNMRAPYRIGKFGDDAWFTSSTNSADVIGNKDYFLCLFFFLNSPAKHRLFKRTKKYFFFFVLLLLFTCPFPSHLQIYAVRMPSSYDKSKKI